jgi:ligand-binding sensor domain-containing protein
MIYPILRILLAGVLCCFCAGASAPVPLPPLSEYVIETWETDRGLPHNSTAGAIQRRDGFVWVATQAGLVRFDGVEFKLVRSPLIEGQRSSSVTAIIEENADTLLITTIQSGLLRVRNGEVTPHPLSEVMDPENKIQLLFREADDVFWVCFRDRQVWRWNRGQIETFPAPQGAHKLRMFSFAKDRWGNIFVARSAVTGVEQYKGGALRSVYNPGWPLALGSSRTGGPWVGAAGKLSRLEKGEVVFTAPGPWESEPMPQLMHEDRFGALWITASEQRLLRWKDGVTTPFEISHVRVNQIDEDELGNIWVSTNGGGLNFVQRTQLALIQGTASWTDATSGSVCEDAKGNIWFANWKSVQRLDGDQIDILSDRPGWPGRGIPICSDEAGNVWMASGTDLLRTTADAAVPPERVQQMPGNVRVLFAGREGSLWVAGSFPAVIRRSRDGTVRSFGYKEGFVSDQTRSIGEGPDGVVWVGTREGRLFRLAGDRFTEPHVGKFGGYEIRALHVDKEGCLWIGTAGAGIFIKRGDRLARIGEAHGLSDEVISQILEDDRGWLWFGSRRGIFKIAKTDLLNCAFAGGETVTSVLFGRGDGLPGVTAVGSYQPTAYKTRSGRLWFVTRKGLVTTDPTQGENDISPPRIYLEQFLVDGRRVQEKGAAIYSSARRVEFRFTSPSFVAPERLSFRYRLDGFDPEWIDGGTQRFAAYSRLPPGKN